MRILILGLAGALAACSSEPAPSANSAAPETPETAVVNEAAIGAPSDAHDDVLLNNAAASTDGAAARFVGKWAATKQLCESGGWRFEEKKLATAGEVSCDFDRVTHVADGYDVEAKCLAESVTSQEVIKLRFAEDDARMRVESKTFRPIELGRCGGQ